MLFNSYVYIFAFLPLTYIAYRLLLTRNLGTRAASLLVVASLIYYAWWNPAYLVLILGSMLVNFEIGRWLQIDQKPDSALRRKWLLIVGIAANLVALGYYKYAGFIGETLNYAFGTGLSIPAVVLPLAISFFTFQQIAYLVDVYRGEAREYRAIHYIL
jgi:alginate O-acetyltransferase complex protein AlgI